MTKTKASIFFVILAMAFAACSDRKFNRAECPDPTCNECGECDITAPLVGSTNPADMTVDVARDTSITITFDEQMEQSSVEAAFAIAPAVAGTFTWDPESRFVDFVPDALLSSNTVYTVTVGTGATDVQGNPLAAELSFSFTTNVLSNLTYATNPATYTIDIAIPDNVPTVAGIADSYSVSPSLPAGLSLDTSTGVISGTPTALTPEASYTVTASNDEATTDVVLTVTIISGPPTNLAYPGQPFDFPRNVAITPETPTVDGTVTDWSVAPALPAGLSLDASGAISGTPTMAQAATDFVITGSNLNGSTQATVNITVSEEPPSSLSYPGPLVLAQGIAMPTASPTVSGDALSFTVSPALPDGLSLDMGTGDITGTPTTLQGAADYTVTASNANGMTTFDLSVSVVPPIGNLSYGGVALSFFPGLPIADLSPTFDGIASGFSVLPALPDGLTLNPTTGVISGTPTTNQAAADYTVTATGLGGMTSVMISIEVVADPPSALSYAGAPFDLPRNVAMAPAPPTVTGTVVTYGISPSLPAGLSLDTSSGVISGTPTTQQSAVGYTITATNPAGMTQTSFNIIVSDEPPNGFSYPLSMLSLTENQVMTPLSATFFGDNVTFDVSPPLPTGLSIDMMDGTISGTPAAFQGPTNYTVTASNANGMEDFLLNIQIALAAPVSVSYPQSTYDFPQDLAVSETPTPVGTVETYSVMPTLPTGLSINATSGEISGVPTVQQSAATYTVTASNSVGFTTVDIDISVGPPVYCPGTTVGGFCWYYGGGGESCDDVCTGNGGYDSDGTVNYAGSGGSNGNCQAVLSALGEDDSDGAVENLSGAFGCASDWSSVANWERYTSPTTSNASSANIHRACACGLVPVPPAPSGLTYTNAPFSFTDNIAITPQTPTYSGTATSFSVMPSLPTGLSLNTTTGEISGTPTTPTAAANYTVTATGPGGSDNVIINIEIVLAPPSGLSYPNAPFVFTGNVAITNQSPTVTGTVASYSVMPALPAGLSLNTSTGVISGTPTMDQSATNYTVTATNASGSTNVVISIEIISVYCPGVVVGGYCWYYGDSGESCDDVCSGQGGCDLTGTRDYAGSGGTNANCQAVLTALGENDSDGIVANLSGAYGCASDWTSVSNWERYTSTTTCAASADGGPFIHRACACNFVPIPDAPSGLSYAGAPYTFNVAIPITPATPTVTGQVDSYSISPSLPSGLNFNTTTGEISGTPSASSASTNYTVTATNAGGTDNVVINIAVTVVPPTGLSYSGSPFIFLQDTAIPTQNPTVTGLVTTYTVQGTSLPTGLSLNGSTGAITGTPTVTQGATNYTIRASNSAGFDETTISITVNAGACDGDAVGGFCWYFGSNNQSCTTVCSTHGGYNAGTQTYAGSGGTNANCVAVLTAVGAISPSPATAQSSIGGINGLGCGSDYTGSATTYRITSTTTEGASSASNGGLFFRRACACND